MELSVGSENWSAPKFRRTERKSTEKSLDYRSRQTGHIWSRERLGGLLRYYYGKLRESLPTSRRGLFVVIAAAVATAHPGVNGRFHKLYSAEIPIAPLATRPTFFDSDCRSNSLTVWAICFGSELDLFLC